MWESKTDICAANDSRYGFKNAGEFFNSPFREMDKHLAEQEARRDAEREFGRRMIMELQICPVCEGDGFIECECEEDCNNE